MSEQSRNTSSSSSAYSPLAVPTSYHSSVAQDSSSMTVMISPGSFQIELLPPSALTFGLLVPSFSVSSVYPVFSQGMPLVVIGSDSTRPSVENWLNAERVNYYRNQFTQQLLRTIRECDFEYGYTSLADVFLRKCLAENALATKEWLNQLFIEYYAQVDITTGILRVIAHLDYEDIAPQGPTMALAALAHPSAEVKECGIRAFENWETLDSLQTLKTVSCSEKWLADYVQQVISDLEECLRYVSSSQED